jgi:hypothetical protein
MGEDFEDLHYPIDVSLNSVEVTFLKLHASQGDSR